MENCHICGLGYSDSSFCPDCGVRVKSHVPSTVRSQEAESPGNRQLRSVVVYQAPDEIAAGNVQKILESAGVDAWMERNPAPGLEGIGPFDGHWGRVLVYEDQEIPSLIAIQSYLFSLGPGLH